MVYLNLLLPFFSKFREMEKVTPLEIPASLCINIVSTTGSNLLQNIWKFIEDTLP